MAQQTINIGSAANDGTGDPIRDAFDKVNDNFNEMYGSFVATGSITVGNSTVNSVVSNTGGLVTGSSTVNAVANSTNFAVANSTTSAVLDPGTLTIGSNLSISTSTVTVGNSTVNTTYNVGQLTLKTAASNTTLTPTTMYVGNSTVYTSVNTTHVHTGSANLTSNTLTLGTSTDSANGYTYLPNGFKMIWGSVEANSTTGTAVFASAYSTNAYVVTATSNTSSDVTYSAAVVAQNNSVVEIRTSNATLTTVYFTAIGK